MKCVAIIPARYESTRLPGKPLREIYGKSMIQRVLEQTYKSKMIQSAVVATDDKRIEQHVKDLGYSVIMTDPELSSGTQRCFAAASKLKLDFDILVNIQGDEPFLDPHNIDILCERMEKLNWPIGTLYTEFKNVPQVLNESNVKLIVNEQNEALYFSRAVIPHCDIATNIGQFKRHVGMYAFNTRISDELSSLPQSSLEIKERLEQLTWLSHGYTIGCEFVQESGVSVDTQEDIDEAILFAQKVEN